MNVVMKMRGRPCPDDSTDVYLVFHRFEVSRGWRRVRLWPRAFRAVAAIMVSPARLTTVDLVNYLYGDRADGGPDSARIIVAVAMHHARKRLAPLGIDFHYVPKMGYEVIDLWTEAAL